MNLPNLAPATGVRPFCRRTDFRRNPKTLTRPGRQPPTPSGGRRARACAAVSTFRAPSADATPHPVPHGLVPCAMSQTQQPTAHRPTPNGLSHPKRRRALNVRSRHTAVHSSPIPESSRALDVTCRRWRTGEQRFSKFESAAVARWRLPVSCLPGRTPPRRRRRSLSRNMVAHES